MEQILLHFPQKEPTPGHLDLGLSASSMVKEKFHVKSRSLKYFVLAALQIYRGYEKNRQ